MLDRGRSGARRRRQTDACGGAPSATRRGRWCRATLRRGVIERLLADGQRPPAAGRGPGLPPARGAEALQGRGRRDLPDQRLRQRRRTSAPARARRRGARRDLPVSISSETSPLAKEYARASTTVIDVFMKLIFTRYAHELDGGLRSSGLQAGSSTSPTARRRCSPWADAIEKPFRIVFAGPAAGTMSSAALSASAIGDGNLICCGRRRHLDATSRSSPTASRSSTTPSSSSTT